MSGLSDWRGHFHNHRDTFLTNAKCPGCEYGSISFVLAPYLIIFSKKRKGNPTSGAIFLVQRWLWIERVWETGHAVSRRCYRLGWPCLASLSRWCWTSIGSYGGGRIWGLYHTVIQFFDRFWHSKIPRWSYNFENGPAAHQNWAKSSQKKKMRWGPTLSSDQGECRRAAWLGHRPEQLLIKCMPHMVNQGSWNRRRIELSQDTEKRLVGLLRHGSVSAPSVRQHAQPRTLQEWIQMRSITPNRWDGESAVRRLLRFPQILRILRKRHVVCGKSEQKKRVVATIYLARNTSDSLARQPITYGTVKVFVGGTTVIVGKK